MRTQAREAAFKILYSRLFDTEIETDFIVTIFNEFALKEDDRAFAYKLFKTANDNFDYFSEKINSLSFNFKNARIFKIDKCAMIICMSEMMYFKEIPNIVSIDECLKIVKLYSTEPSVNFVNGILGTYNQELLGEHTDDKNN